MLKAENVTLQTDITQTDQFILENNGLSHCFVKNLPLENLLGAFVQITDAPEIFTTNKPLPVTISQKLDPSLLSNLPFCKA